MRTNPQKLTRPLVLAEKNVKRGGENGENGGTKDGERGLKEKEKEEKKSNQKLILCTLVSGIILFILVVVGVVIYSLVAKKDEEWDKSSLRCLEVHNTYRSKHGVPGLILDQTLYKAALGHSRLMAKSGSFRHSNNGYGENIYASTAAVNPCDAATHLWYSEISKYDFEKGTGSDSGHFTQVVWKHSQRLGCAGVESKIGSLWTYVTCNYDPPGNVGSSESYKANVLRPIKSKREIN